MSFILPGNRLCYALVNRFQQPDEILANSLDGRVFIVTNRFNCQKFDCQTAQDRHEFDKEFNLINAISNEMVCILKDWNKKDIVDETRSDQLCVLLKNLLLAVGKK